MKEILFTGKIQIYSYDEQIPTKMKCDVIKEGDSLIIKLINLTDVFSFYICTINNDDFYILKREQDLIVDYHKFIEIIIKLFHMVQNNSLSAYFLDLKFMFVEKNEFRNIIKLELKFKEPTDLDYKSYIGDFINRLENDNIKLIKENSLLKDYNNNTLHRKIRNLEENQNAHINKINMLNKQTDEYKYKLEKTTLEMKNLNNQVYELERENTKLKLENDSNMKIREDFSNLNLKNKNLEKDLEVANEIIKKIRSENLEYKNKIEEIENNIKKRHDEVEKYENNLEEIKKKNKITEEKYKKFQKENKEIKNRIKELEVENQALIRKLENAQSVFNHFSNNKEIKEKYSSDSISEYSIHPEEKP
ncbi:spindle assembly abnormal 6-like protein [Vairimorpha necatrix]|uniref:Spindle assembly abnormal 6-like protein n=1 Tax=Vairimorpha necatrix TaxID=6039 RepID=A0AAX4J9U2_9MICR